MLIKIIHKTDLITLDFSLKEIRYLKNTSPKDLIFIPLSNNDIEGYRNLLEVDKRLFLSCLKDDLLKEGIKVNLNDLEILK